MNKKNNIKGFTTVELVIVIAVIAILATVLIPTFSNLIGKANESAALQEASNVLKSYTLENAADITHTSVVYVVSGDYVFKATGSQMSKTPESKDTKVPCNAIVITKASDAKGFETEDTLPTGYAFAACVDASTPADNKCDNCGKTVTP